MKADRKIFLVFLALGLAFWVVDAIQDYLFFYEGIFWDLLIAHLPPHELVIRASFLVLTAFLGWMMARYVTRLRDREEKLTDALRLAESRQTETAALLQATQEVLQRRGFAEAARAIFNHCREAIGSTGGYISLADAAGTQMEIIFLEAGGLPCTADPETPMPLRGLRAEAFRKAQVIYDNHFSESPYRALLPEGHLPLRNVLFAPLMFQGKPIGLLGLGNKPGGFTDHDAALASGFAELAAIALVSERAAEERNRLFQALETERAFLKAVIEHLPAGITIAEAPSGKILLGNKELKNIWHLSDLADNLRENLSQVRVFHPDGRPLDYEEWPLVRSLSQGETVISEEVEVIRRDGSQCSLSVSSAPIRDSHGTIIAAVGTCIDITERRRAEEALRRIQAGLEEKVRERTAELSRTVERLRLEVEEKEKAQARLTESEARFRALLQTAGTLIVTVDPDGRIIEFNQEAERATGWQRQEVQGKIGFPLVFTAKNQAIAKAEMQKLLAGEMIRGFELPIRTKDGRERIYLWNANLVSGLGEIIAAGQDITELKQAEEKLRLLTSQLLDAQEEERRRLSRELHDELGQSLLVLKMQTSALARQLPPDQSVLRENCDRALKYIDEIIDKVRRLSRDLCPAILEDLGLAAALNNVCEEFCLHHENIRLRKDLEKEIYPIAKEAQIHVFRIFQEALTNVAKHAGATHVKVSLRKQGNLLLGAIEDNGIGFDPAEARTKESYARGVGLAAMEERVRTLGGTLQISSARGQGTKVSFTIPLSAGDQRK